MLITAETLVKIKEPHKKSDERSKILSALPFKTGRPSATDSPTDPEIRLRLDKDGIAVSNQEPFQAAKPYLVEDAFMAKKIQILNDSPASVGRETASLKNDILRHIRFTLGNDPDRLDKYAFSWGLHTAFAIG